MDGSQRMRVLRVLVSAMFVVAVSAGAAHAASLTTTFASNNGQSGNMFDVVTAGNALTVNSLSVNLDPGNYTIEVYTRPGSWQANPNSSAGWTLVGTVAVTSAGTDNPTLANVPDFVLPANSTTGIYVTTNGPTAINYTNGTGVGNIAAQNPDLQILEGAGVAYPFAGVFSPRVWNGTITYAVVTEVAEKTDTRRKTVQAIQRFLHRRNDQLLSNGPDIDRQIGRLSGAGGSQTNNGSGFASSGQDDASGQRVARDSDIAAGTRLSALGGPQDAAGAFGTGDARTGSLTGDTIAGRSGSLGESGRMSSLPLGLQVGDVGENGTRFSFATSLTDMAKNAAEAKRRKLAGGEENLKALGLDGVALVEPNTYALDVWVQGTYASYEEGATGGRSDGDFGVLYIGMDYVLSPAVLVGALFQYDQMKDYSADLGTRTEGNGWMVGPYVTVRAMDNVFVQGRAAWGKSDNDISPFLTYEDSFKTERWLVEGNVQGRWAYDAWTLNPRASIAYIEEDQEGYTDSLGFVIPSQTVSLGQARFGPRVGYLLTAADGTRLEPYVGIEGIWNFNESGTSLVAGTLASQEEFRGRVDVGLRALSLRGFGLDLQGSYDGIGADNYEAYSGEVRVMMPLN